MPSSKCSFRAILYRGVARCTVLPRRRYSMRILISGNLYSHTTGDLALLSLVCRAFSCHGSSGTSFVDLGNSLVGRFRCRRWAATFDDQPLAVNLREFTRTRGCFTHLRGRASPFGDERCLTSNGQSLYRVRILHHVISLRKNVSPEDEEKRDTSRL